MYMIIVIQPRTSVTIQLTNERKLSTFPNVMLELLKAHHFHFEGPTLHLLTGDFTHGRRGVIIVIAIDVFVLFREILQSIVILIKLQIKGSTISDI